MEKLESQSVLNPQNIKWKYFHKNTDGDVVISYQEPKSDIKRISPLLLNSGVPSVPTAKDGDPQFHKAFQSLAEEGLCVCIPCDPSKESVSGISKAGSTIDESLLADLQFRTETYKTPTPFQYPLSPIEGAEQAVSAISKGYDIIDYAGGLGMAEKVPHILQYFRDNPVYLPKKKPKFWGFSGATHSVVLHEILEPVCSPNLFMINEFRGKSENIDFALKAMRGEVDSIDQKLIPLNAIAEKNIMPITLSQKMKIYQCILLPPIPLSITYILQMNSDLQKIKNLS